MKPETQTTSQPMVQQATKPACETCPVHNAAQLQRLGVDMQDWDFVVALAGNPNVGKSTVFNALTGLRQHTGNWPGKTVARAEGGFDYGDKRFKLVDLPGAYSLLATSLDEEVARDFILFGQPDVTLVVIDATRLDRNLNLGLQILQITDRVVICLYLMDEARRRGLAVDERRLARNLGVPVVPTSARSQQGLDDLLKTIHAVCMEEIVPRARHIQNEPPDLKRVIDTLTEQILQVFPGLPNARWVALRLLDGDERITAAIERGELGELHTEQAGENPRKLEVH
ncbi:MAG TPA: FeoB small GTPase domain-containing protein [Anaerolineales bacterium]|nr:FeoB small GTPase domain-containing protein [Anaerolineales bacterium]